ncbi:outer membrane protein assembly factor BamB family protein [Ferruginibacter sp.]
MKNKKLLPALLLLGVIGLTAWQMNSDSSLTKTTKKYDVDTATAAIDILPQVLELNGDDKYKPVTDFRPGNVTTAKIDHYYKKTADGYCIQLPSTTNIPTPSVINGTVYLSGGFGSKQYYAFDAVSGKNKWAINLDDDGPSSPAIADGMIVFNTESCTIFACDTANGRPVWSYYLGDPLMSMPSIHNGIVFTSYPARYTGKASTGQNNNALFPSHVLIAIELKTGKILWQKWIDSDIMSAPVAKDDLLYVTTFSGALYKVKEQTGEIIEAKAIRATSAPVFSSGNEIVVSRRDDNTANNAVGEAVVIGYGRKQKSVYKKEAAYLDMKVQDRSKLKGTAATADAGNGFASGAPASANYTMAYSNIGQSNVSSLQSFQGSRTLYKNERLYNTMGDEIICTDSSGTVQWKHSLGGDIKSEGGFMGTPPVYANGYIIVATLKGEVLLFDEKKGELIKTYNIQDPVRYQPVADNGWIFVTTVNSKMYAINTGNPAITGWNMWGGNAARTNEN